MSLGRHADAARAAEEWIASAPEQSAPHAHHSWTLLANGEYVAAEDAAQRACAISAEWDWPLRLLAAAAFNQGEHARARDLQLACLRLAPWNADHHYFLARIHDTQGEREAALTAARRAVELEPSHPEYLRSLHERELVFGPSDFEIFEHYYKLRGVLALNPCHAATLADLAKVHEIYFADSASAERLLREALEIEPDNPDLHSKLSALIRDRDSWFVAMFHLTMPLLCFIMGFLVLAKETSVRSKLTFVLYVMGPCALCGIPATILYLIPAATYCGIAFSGDWISPDSTSFVGRIARRLAESVVLRRLIWTPIAIAWWGLVAWILPISAWWTVVGIVAGIVVVVAFDIQNRAHRQRRAIAHKLFVASDIPRRHVTHG